MVPSGGLRRCGPCRQGPATPGDGSRGVAYASQPPFLGRWRSSVRGAGRCTSPIGSFSAFFGWIPIRKYVRFAALRYRPVFAWPAGENRGKGRGEVRPQGWRPICGALRLRGLHRSNCGGIPRGNCRNGGLDYEHGNCGFCRRLLYCRNSRDGRDRLRTNRRFNPCRFARLSQRMHGRRLQPGRLWRRLLHHLRRATGAAARRRPRVPRNTVSGLGFHWTGSLLDWAVGGSLLAVLSTFLSYRALTRQFGWGPRDT